MKLVTKIFGRPEEINGADRCPTYLYRWHLMSTRWFKLYLHHFVGDDWSLDLHDHPKRFISIGLKGWYVEERPTSHGVVYEEFHAPWLRSFPAEHVHRITTPSKSCWTIVAVLKTVRPWGFWHEGRFIHWREYVHSSIADEMKACVDREDLAA